MGRAWGQTECFPSLLSKVRFSTKRVELVINVRHWPLRIGSTPIFTVIFNFPP